MLYTYGADGLRTQKIVGANEIHSYGWSGGRLVYERMGTSAYSTMGTGSTQGTQSAQKVLTPPAASAYDRTLYFLYDAGGSPIGFILLEGSRMPAIYYYVKNLQGDVLGIIDGGGSVKAAYRYNAWGEILSATGELAELNPLRYRGYYYDSETGLYYLQSRYYDPVVGRFLNADAVPMLGANGDFIGYNLFAYCGNNPVNMVDSCGELALTATAVAVMILLGGLTLTGVFMANDPRIYKAADDIARGIRNGIENTFSYYFGSSPASPSPGPNRNDDPVDRNWKKVDDKYLKQKLKDQGINPHELKYDYLGKRADVAEYDIYVDKNTGQLAIFRKSTGLLVEITDYFLL